MEDPQILDGNLQN